MTLAISRHPGLRQQYGSYELICLSEGYADEQVAHSTAKFGKNSKSYNDQTIRLIRLKILHIS